ncbi:hypothetical protein T4E_12110 [Trichinella pseudospiralis]|uniref:Uncharacterized protein n=1 Tax=Trichinella pseudospiralis TaxID=6337 RepID=A0A0V0W8L9_TRIPS|nr:hypothetical protein T4E_12110 [Trichinella pseudospiralis]
MIKPSTDQPKLATSRPDSTTPEGQSAYAKPPSPTHQWTSESPANPTKPNVNQT